MSDQAGRAPDRFRDRSVVVIGGNSGIGLAAARRFAAEGARVAIMGRNPETIESACRQLGAESIGEAVDVSDTAATRDFLRRTGASRGGIDVLFVNAGIGWFSDVRNIAEEHWQRLIAVNLTGAFFAAQSALPMMGRGGSILFTSSAGSRVPVRGNVGYAASKAGLRAAARIMAFELASEGIRVNVLSPGGIDTPILQRDQGIDPARLAETGAAFMAAVPMGRIGNVDEVAATALFLCSDEASYITGIDMFVDGGITML